MGLRDRLRKLAIQAGNNKLRHISTDSNAGVIDGGIDADLGKLVVDARAKAKGTPSSMLQSVVEKVTKPAIDKILGPKITRMNLVKQVEAARGMLRMMGMASFRKSFLPGFGDDIRDRVKQGLSDEEVLKPYLECPEFMKFWGTLGMDEDHLKALVDDVKGK